MKLDFSGDVLDTWGYDRDNGAGAAERAIAELDASGDTNSADIQAEHERKVLKEAENVRGHLDEDSVISEDGNVAAMRLGLSDMAEHLEPKLDAAVANLKD